MDPVFPQTVMHLSPNRSSRNGAKVTTLVWHYTGGVRANPSIRWLCNEVEIPSKKLKNVTSKNTVVIDGKNYYNSHASSHFIIDRNGAITQMVPLDEKAWHCGGSIVSNAQSIGVELVNPGYVYTDEQGNYVLSGGQKWKPDIAPIVKSLIWPSEHGITKLWVPYTEQQQISMIKLCIMLSGTEYRDCLNDQCGHEDIARPEGRKTDPGPLFPWGAVSELKQRKRHTTRSK
jgi:N-acetyl-anhydromuramyl-L-alanine amidase AmpD